ncbi:MAG: winged helix-turn-helix domain-containing protein [Rhodothermia bacterium]
MRPLATRQSELRFPLDLILGTKAQIRVLRLLSDSGRAVSATEISKNTGLTLPGTLKVLDRLTKTGLVTVVGSGRSRLFSLPADNPLLDALRRLFESERDRYDDLIDELRIIFATVTTPLESAWLRLDKFTLGGPVKLGFLTNARLLSSTRSELQHRLASFQDRFDVTAELSGYTRADLPELEEENIHLLAGVPPSNRSKSSFSARSHSDLEARSLERAARLADMIRRDPSIVSRAQRYLKRVLERDSDATRTDLVEWQSIVETYSQRRLLEFLVASTVRARRLRQSSPFLAVLNSKEKAQFRSSEESHDA